MSYLDFILLYCLKTFNGERSLYAVLHLLKGKKSAQTIQDAHFFQIGHLFQTYTPLTREQLNEMAEKLVKSKLISVLERDHYHLTDKGNVCMEKYLKEKPIPLFLNGLKFHYYTELFWQRLSLLIQVTSNGIHNERHYMPIQKDHNVILWIKYFLRELKLPQKELSRKLFDELSSCLDKKDMDAALFVPRLTGYKRIGLTSEQVAAKVDMEETYYHYSFLNILHYCIAQILHDSASYPILQSIISDIQTEWPLTYSAAKTYKMLQEGYSISEIGKNRNLKTSTIEDHLVEISLTIADFHLELFVPEELQLKIIQSAKKSGSKKLKRIKDEIPQAEYLQIRLVLAKFGGSI